MASTIKICQEPNGRRGLKPLVRYKHDHNIPEPSRHTGVHLTSWRMCDRLKSVSTALLNLERVNFDHDTALTVQICIVPIFVREQKHSDSSLPKKRRGKKKKRKKEKKRKVIIDAPSPQTSRRCCCCSVRASPPAR